MSTGHCSIANEPIRAGETVAAFGGRCVTRDELEQLRLSQQHRSIQIDDDLFLAGAIDPEPGDFVNHSCEPNCGLSGSVLVVALRDIDAGEELTYDFAMSDGSDDDEFECHCGAAAVPRQGHGARLDAARAAAAVPGPLQPLPQPAHLRAGVPSAPSAACSRSDASARRAVGGDSWRPACRYDRLACV